MPPMRQDAPFFLGEFVVLCIIVLISVGSVLICIKMLTRSIGSDLSHLFKQQTNHYAEKSIY
jgi:hypothetical protein